MISSVGQNNNVQRFSAVNAFRSNSKPLKAEEQNSLQDEQALCYDLFELYHRFLEEVWKGFLSEFQSHFLFL